MGKGKEWSESETTQLVYSWLETSEDPIRGTGQKKESFNMRLYTHWRNNKSAVDVEERSATAIAGRWKKIQPEVSKFDGIYKKVKSKERSGWSEEMYVETAVKIYDERTKQPFEFIAAWQILRNAPKWSEKMTATVKTASKRTAGEAVGRPIGRKAAKDEAREQREKKKTKTEAADPHARYAAAAEKKAGVMEQQLMFNIFMQDPHSAESREFFQIQRTRMLAALKKPEHRSAASLPASSDEDSEHDAHDAHDAHDRGETEIADASLSEIHSIEEDESSDQLAQQKHSSEEDESARSYLLELLN